MMTKRQDARSLLPISAEDFTSNLNAKSVKTSSKSVFRFQERTFRKTKTCLDELVTVEAGACASSGRAAFTSGELCSFAIGGVPAGAEPAGFLHPGKRVTKAGMTSARERPVFMVDVVQAAWSRVNPLRP